MAAAATLGIVVVAAFFAGEALTVDRNSTPSTPIPVGTIEVSVSGLDDSGGDHLVGVLYPGGDPPFTMFRDGIGGFSVTLDGGSVSTLVYEPIIDPEPTRGVPFPFVTDEALTIDPGTYTLWMMRSPQEPVAYSRWVPGEPELGSSWCELTFTVERDAGISLEVTGGFGSSDRSNARCTAVVGGPLASLTEAGPEFGAEPRLSRSGDTLWAWDVAGRVAGYRQGGWRVLPEPAGYVVALFGDVDDVAWALTVDGFPPGGPGPTLMPDDITTMLWTWSPGQNGWSMVDGIDRALSLADVEGLIVDTATGTIWIPGAEPAAWHGSGDVVFTGSLPEELVIDDLAITSDGSLWAARWNPFFPNLPAGLIRHESGIEGWSWVRPVDGSRRQRMAEYGLIADVPSVLHATPSGQLWVVQMPYGSDGPPILAHLDTNASAWVLREIPLGPPIAWSPGLTTDLMVWDYQPLTWGADDEAVWVVSGSERGEILRLTGDTWTAFPADFVHDDIGDIEVAADGSVWVATPDGLYRLLFAGSGDP